MTQIRSTIVELAIFKLTADGPKYLLLHRTKEEEAYPDIWQFVTGSIEEGEMALDAALRELQEETGLSAISVWTVPYLISFNAHDTINFSPFFAAETDPEMDVRLSAEHDQFLWLPLKEAQQMVPWPSWKEGLGVVHELIASSKDFGSTYRLA